MRNDTVCPFQECQIIGDLHYEIVVIVSNFFSLLYVVLDTWKWLETLPYLWSNKMGKEEVPLGYIDWPLKTWPTIVQKKKKKRPDLPCIIMEPTMAKINQPNNKPTGKIWNKLMRNLLFVPLGEIYWRM